MVSFREATNGDLEPPAARPGTKGPIPHRRAGPERAPGDDPSQYAPTAARGTDPEARREPDSRRNSRSAWPDWKLLYSDRKPDSTQRRGIRVLSFFATAPTILIPAPRSPEPGPRADSSLDEEIGRAKGADRPARWAFNAAARVVKMGGGFIWGPVVRRAAGHMGRRARLRMNRIETVRSTPAIPGQVAWIHRGRPATPENRNRRDEI
jgi:hypothetical protein